ncbi:hypothetical protein KIL84_004469 [Mauremys mutica]|uniref:Uncharacterized protein n=1 Tax=Mauremys mutica TaxID=74926 RepID=A0A9D3XN12_9SAUR|nr:hypothetical protein KIL84_004469 [Mauremys mutica]
MGPATEAAESEVPLQELHVDGDGHQETVGEPESHRNSRKCNCRKSTIILTVALTAVSLGLIVALILLAGPRPKLPSADLGPPVGPTCPDGWIGYQGKCYYFSEVEGNWNYSQSHCSSLSASLAGIDNEQDLVRDALITTCWSWLSGCCSRTRALPVQGEEQL